VEIKVVTSELMEQQAKNAPHHRVCIVARRIEWLPFQLMLFCLARKTIYSSMGRCPMLVLKTAVIIRPDIRSDTDSWFMVLGSWADFLFCLFFLRLPHY